MISRTYCKQEINSVVSDRSDKWDLKQCQISNEKQYEAITKLQETVDMLSSKVITQDEIIANNQNKNERVSEIVESLTQHVYTRPDSRCKYQIV